MFKQLIGRILMNISKHRIKSHIEHETLQSNRKNIGLDKELGEYEKKNIEEK
jgi:hypothetical protein